MVRNEEKYQLATDFRKRGFTYSEIAKICDVSKSTVSVWLSKKAFSKKVKKENIVRASRENVKRIALVNKARNAERKARYAEAIRSAETEYKHYKKDPLFVAGLMLYSTSHDAHNTSRIRFTSNEYHQHRIFIKFVTSYLGVERKKIGFWLLLSEKESSTAVKFWSKKINLPISQFGKTQFVFSQKAKPLHNGTGNTIIGNTVLKHKLNRWVELAFKEL